MTTLERHRVRLRYLARRALAPEVPADQRVCLAACDADGVPLGLACDEPAELAETEATARELDRSIDELYPEGACFH